MVSMNINLGTQSIGSMRFAADRQVSAQRGCDIVTLGVPFDFDLVIEPQSTWLADNTRAELYAVGPGGTETLLAIGEVPVVLESRNFKYAPEVIIAFQCSPKALAVYERTRSGKPVDLRIKCVFRIHSLEPSQGYRKMLCSTQYVWAQDDFRVDTTRWIKALRSVALSASVLIEIPFPLESDPSDEALVALQHAMESFDNGGSIAWKNTVGHIRPYLEEWKKREPTPTQAAQLGSPADRQLKLLNCRDTLYKACHFWVHDSAAGTSRDDALFALSTFAALLKAYRS